MLVGIHIDPHKGFNKPLERYEKILELNRIDYVRLDVSKSDFWQQVKNLDIFIMQYYGTHRQQQIARTVIPIIENDLGIKCFPNNLMSWLYNDKVREYYFLNQNSFPTIPTWIFWDKSEAQKWLSTASLPVVFKLKGGASSENVVLVSNKPYGNRLISKMFRSGIISGNIPGFTSMKWKNIMTIENMRRFGGNIRRFLKGQERNIFDDKHQNYVLFQKFLPNNEIDTRICVIGGRISGDIRYVRNKDFRASGSGRCDVDQSKIDHRCIEIALSISQKVGFTMMCYDFLFDENNLPLISEMSYIEPDWGIWDRPGYWDVDLNWHPGHFWPQYFILQDLLNMPDLIQPEMKP
jgi:glutathione synthase/RimK-type ligase-like ATP-grasp enzyme